MNDKELTVSADLEVRPNQDVSIEGFIHLILQNVLYPIREVIDINVPQKNPEDGCRPRFIIRVRDATAHQCIFLINTLSEKDYGIRDITNNDVAAA